MSNAQWAGFDEPSISSTVLPDISPAVSTPTAEDRISASQEDKSILQALARELHDGVTQEVWYLQTELSCMSDRRYDNLVELQADLERLKKVAQEAYQELRTTLDVLNSHKATYSILSEELAELVKKFSDSVNMKITFECDRQMLRKAVVGDVARQVRRLVQEALWNSFQHSMSESAKVTLNESKAGLMVIISDDGCGFDYDTVETNHYGLRNMRERAEAINGSLYVTSKAGKGTQITLQVPSEETRG